jgi:hypothetical protein
VPGGRDGFTLVTSVPLDFSLSAGYTVRIRVAQKRNPLPGAPLFDVLVKQLAHPDAPS